MTIEIINQEIMEQEIQLNEHNKQEYPPMHSAEHLLNQTMVRMFGCPRSKNTHIERKKSKADYFSIEFVTRDNVPEGVDLSKLPEDASETLRIVRIGDYDTCACIGAHVNNTSEIGKFKIISSDYADGRLRIRFKLE